MTEPRIGDVQVRLEALKIALELRGNAIWGPEGLARSADVLTAYISKGNVPPRPQS